jgi:hypothetical protein
MLPGFSADASLYRSRVHYVCSAVETPLPSGFAPAATNVCASSGGGVQCGTISGIGEGILWGALIGGALGPGGSLIGGVLGGVFCWLFGCD